MKGRWAVRVPVDESPVAPDLCREYRVDQRMALSRKWYVVDTLPDQSHLPVGRRHAYALSRLADWRDPKVNRDAIWLVPEDFRLSWRMVSPWHPDDGVPLPTDGTTGPTPT